MTEQHEHTRSDLFCTKRESDPVWRICANCRRIMISSCVTSVRAISVRLLKEKGTELRYKIYPSSSRKNNDQTTRERVRKD